MDSKRGTGKQENASLRYSTDHGKEMVGSYRITLGTEGETKQATNGACGML